MKFNKVSFSKNNSIVTNISNNQSNNKPKKTNFERCVDICIRYTVITLSLISSLSFMRHLSPIKTTNNTKWQLERNQKGILDLLSSSL